MSSPSVSKFGPLTGLGGPKTVKMAMEVCEVHLWDHPNFTIILLGLSSDTCSYCGNHPLIRFRVRTRLSSSAQPRSNIRPLPNRPNCPNLVDPKYLELDGPFAIRCPSDGRLSPDLSSDEFGCSVEEDQGRRVLDERGLGRGEVCGGGVYMA